MSSLIKLHFNEEDMEYSHDMWDAGRMVLSDVNEILKKMNIDLKFELNVHGYDEEEAPDDNIEIINQETNNES